MTTPTTSAKTLTAREFSKDEKNAALKAHKIVREAEKQGATADVALARALRTLRDEGTWAVIERPEGGTVTSWSDYCEHFVPTRSPAWIAKACRVAAFWPTEDPAEIVKAGIEKAYVASKLNEQGFLAGTRTDILKAAQENSLPNLIAMRTAAKPRTAQLVYLEELKVPEAVRFEFQGLRQKSRAALLAGDPNRNPTPSEEIEFAVRTFNGLPDEFLARHTDGIGGVDPDEFGGEFTDLPLEQIVVLIGEKYLAAGKDPAEVMAGLDASFRKLSEQAQERLESAEREAKARAKSEAAQKKADDAAKRKAERAAGATRSRVQKAKKADKLTFGNGIVAEMVDVFNTNEPPQFALNVLTGKTLRKGDQEWVIDAGQHLFTQDEVATWGEVTVEKYKAPKPEKKPAKERASAGEVGGNGLSKAEQAGKGKGKGKKGGAPVTEAEIDQSLEF